MSHSLSSIRSKSLFPSPPKVRVVTGLDHATEAASLSEALDSAGAEAEVRIEIEGDTIPADVYVIDFAMLSSCPHPSAVVIGVADSQAEIRGRDAEADLVLVRPVEINQLLHEIELHLHHASV